SHAINVDGSGNRSCVHRNIRAWSKQIYCFPVRPSRIGLQTSLQVIATLNLFEFVNDDIIRPLQHNQIWVSRHVQSSWRLGDFFASGSSKKEVSNGAYNNDQRIYFQYEYFFHCFIWYNGMSPSSFSH